MSRGQWGKKEKLASWWWWATNVLTIYRRHKFSSGTSVRIGSTINQIILTHHLGDVSFPLTSSSHYHINVLKRNGINHDGLYYRHVFDKWRMYSIESLTPFFLHSTVPVPLPTSLYILIRGPAKQSDFTVISLISVYQSALIEKCGTGRGS